MFRSKKFDLKNDTPKNPYSCLKPFPGNSTRPKFSISGSKFLNWLVVAYKFRKCTKSGQNIAIFSVK